MSATPEPRVKKIVSRDNPGYKALRRLAEDAREQRRQGLTLLDGVHLVAAYRDKVGLPQRLIVSEHGLQQGEVQAVLASLPAVDVWLLGDGLFHSLSELSSPPGLMAQIAVPAPRQGGSVSGASCVLLDGVQDSGNVGSILRSAAAAGLRQVYLGSGCAGAWTPRVLRAGQGAHFDLDIHEQVALEEVLAAFAGLTLAASAHADASLYQLDLRGPVAWLFGSEGQGIRPALEVACWQRMTIPLAAGSESLNVAAAAAVCLFEEVRQKIHTGHVAGS